MREIIESLILNGNLTVVGAFVLAGICVAVGWNVKGFFDSHFVDRARTKMEEAEDSLKKCREHVASLNAHLKRATDQAESERRSMAAQARGHEEQIVDLKGELARCQQWGEQKGRELAALIGGGPSNSYESAEPAFTIHVSKRFPGHLQVHGDARCIMGHHSKIDHFDIHVQAEPRA